MKYWLIALLVVAACATLPKKTFTDYYKDCTAKYKKSDAETQCTAYALNVCTSPMGGGCQ